MSPRFAFLKPRLAAVLVSLVGVGLFHLLGLPLPFLFGPMAASLVAALAGLRLAGFGPVSQLARTVLGVAAGASVTMAVVAQLPAMAATIALVPLYVVVIALVGVPFFRRLGYDPVTAWYAAMPGGLQDMVLFGQEAGGDARALSLIHATRVLVIVTVAPVVLTQLYGVSLSQPIGAPASTLPLSEMAIMLAAAVIGWRGAARIGLFGAAILGPLIVAAALSLTGVIEHRPPREAILFSQFVIGASLGASYVGVTVAELRKVVLSGVAFVMILAALAAAFAEAIHLMHLAQPVETFLAFAPGGQAEMVLLAIVAGADLGFVVAHHVTRMIVVILGAPLAARLFTGRTRPPD